MPDENESKIILYTTPDGKSQVSLMSRDGRIWLNQKQMAELFSVSKPNVSMLIAKIFAEKELDDSVVKCYLTTAADGKNYKVIYYALEMAKNYLSADEIDTLNRITTIFLETAELRVKRKMDLTLPFWQQTVDGMLRNNLFEVLDGPGRVSHEDAVKVSDERYDEFDDRRKKEEARLADEADMAELLKIEEEAKKRDSQD